MLGLAQSPYGLAGVYPADRQRTDEKAFFAGSLSAIRGLLPGQERYAPFVRC